MADVLLSTDSLTVAGGPASVSVDVDFGPQGQRGSLILYGLTDPNDQKQDLRKRPIPMTGIFKSK